MALCDLSRRNLAAEVGLFSSIDSSVETIELCRIRLLSLRDPILLTLCADGV